MVWCLACNGQPSKAHDATPVLLAIWKTSKQSSPVVQLITVSLLYECRY